jgi:hypothetical protein
MAAQDWPEPVRWIVATDGGDDYEFPEGAEVRYRRFDPTVNSLAANLLLGLESLGPDDRVLLVEDDDYYAPGYLSAYAERLGWYELLGAPNSRYYNVAARRWRRLDNNRHASLAQTGVTGPAIDTLRSVCRSRLGRLDKPFLDLDLWRSFQGRKTLDPALSGLHIGIKGLPGTPGYGIGHRDTFGMPDEHGDVARAWGLPAEYEAFRDDDEDESP